MTTPLPDQVPVALKFIRDNVPVKFPFIVRPPVFNVKAPFITEPLTLMVVVEVTVAFVGITRVLLAPSVKLTQDTTPFEPANVVVNPSPTESVPANVCNALVVRVPVPDVVQLFQVTVPANVRLPLMISVDPVVVTVPAV